MVIAGLCACASNASEAPNGSPESASGAAGQGLSPNDVRNEIFVHFSDFQNCADQLKSFKPTNVRVEISISPEGSVSSAILVDSTGDERIQQCVLREFKRLHFPSADKPTGASFPLRFTQPPQADRDAETN